MKGEEKQAMQAVEQIGSVIDAETRDKYNDVLKKVPTGSLSLHHFLNMDPVKIENVYAQAYRLYNNGKYKDAAQIFRYLVMICPGEIRYMLGLGACCQLLKAYKPAVDVYMLCNMIDSQSPIADFHASDCYLQMKDKVSALVCLGMAIEKAGSKPEYQILKGRAMLTVEALEKELKLAKS